MLPFTCSLYYRNGERLPLTFFSFQVRALMQTNTSRFIIAMIFNFDIVLIGGGDGV